MFKRFVHLLSQHEAHGSVPLRIGRQTYPSHVTVNPPASPEKIAAVEQKLGYPLPADYRRFLMRWDGACLFAQDERDTPRIFSTQELLGQPYFCHDQRLLIIGMLADEAFLLLNRQGQTTPGWPVYWADECDSAEEVLARPPIAGSLAEFLDRYIEAQGSWHWQTGGPLEWYRDPHTPGLWRHGLGLYFLTIDYPIGNRGRYFYRIGLPVSSYAMTTPAAMIAVGIRDYLLRLGATFGVPAEFG